MIPARPGTYLVLHSGRTIGDVIAWDNEGRPMVEQRGCLVAVDPTSIRHSYEDSNPMQYESYVQFTPVSGLRALYRDDDGALFDTPLIGWGVTTGGDIVPVSEEVGDGMMAVSRDEGYLGAFHESEREKVYRKRGPLGFLGPYADRRI